MKNSMSQNQASSSEMIMFGPAKMNHELKLMPDCVPYSLKPQYSYHCHSLTYNEALPSVF